MSDEEKPGSQDLAATQAAFARRRRLIPAIIGAGLFMHNLDGTVVANALPTMARDLNETPVSLNLSISLYLLSSAIFLPISGWIADRFGARRVFIAAMAGFGLASLLCGLSGSLLAMNAARVLQGMAGAMMLPVGRLVLLRSTPREELFDSMAILTIPAIVAPILGPPIGGFIISIASWRWIFYLNIPVAILGMALTYTFVPRLPADPPGRLDIVGFLLTAVGLGGLVFGMENAGGHGGMPAWVSPVALAAGIVAFLLYLPHARGRPDPIVDFTLLRIPTVYAALVGGIFPRLLAGSMPFLTALLLQIGLGYSALEAGGLTTAAAIGALTVRVTSPIFMRWFSFRDVLVWSTLLLTVTTVAYTLLSPGGAVALIIVVLLTSGFFRAMTFTALTTLTFADIPHAQASRSTTLLGISQQTMQAVGVSVGALLLNLAMSMTGTPGIVTVTAAGWAFVIVAVINLVGLLFFLRLPPDAGSALKAKRDVDVED